MALLLNSLRGMTSQFLPQHLSSRWPTQGNWDLAAHRQDVWSQHQSCSDSCKNTLLRDSAPLDSAGVQKAPLTNPLLTQASPMGQAR